MKTVTEMNKQKVRSEEVYQERYITEFSAMRSFGKPR